MSFLCCGNLFTTWTPSEELKRHYPARHSDYRDSLPLDLKRVYEIYQPHVKNGAWTFGLFEMWFFKAKPVKHSVHIPCWDSFTFNPLRWRGICFGRTLEQCFWTGLKQMRWSRGTYAAALGREYIMPVKEISRHGRGFTSDIKALCILYFAMGTVFGMGFGQIFTVCGNFMFNFAACFSCHSREKIRRKYKLPPTFGLPPGIDDCLVHFLCAYCASHQEARELAVRGVDGPGMHIFDVSPEAWAEVEGYDEALASRQKLVADMVANPPRLFKPRKKHPVEHGAAKEASKAVDADNKLGSAEHGEAGAVDMEDDAMYAASEVSNDNLGWLSYCPPCAQAMKRGQDQTTQLQQLLENGTGRVLKRAWSVAY